MQWWGPVLHELYGASESYGNCHISPGEVRTHPGSVGRAIRGRIHITDDNGDEHVFLFETFSNSYDVFTLITYVRRHDVLVAVPQRI